MPIALNVNVYERWQGGVPGTDLVDDLGGRLDSYSHSIVARGGFESMQCVLTMGMDEAINWLQNGLMRSVIVYGPDAEIVWEGYLSTVEATFGQERRSLSLDGMANRVRVRYTDTSGGASTTSTSSDTDSQGRYGVKDTIYSLGEITSTAASNLAATALAARKDPQSRPGASATTGNVGGVAVTLTFAGWYTTLDWLLLTATSTSTTSTTTQVGSYLTTIASTNNFISTSTQLITSSGISDTEYVGQETSYRSRIEKLLGEGNSSNQRLAWGVYEGRQFRAAAWAGATPSTYTYQRSLRSADVFDAYGNVVPPWDVRPDAMYQVIELLDVGPVATAQDAASRFYAERVTCNISGTQIGVTLEPTDVDDMSAVLARLQG